jgi:hypothetical protein
MHAAIRTQQGGICGFFSTINAAIRTQIQQGGICGLFSTSNAATRTGRHLRICTTPPNGFLAVLVPNGTMPHDGFPIDLGSAATMNNVTASVSFFTTVLRLTKVSALILQHPLTMRWQILHTNCWSALLNNMFFDDVCATDALNFHKRRY